MPGAALLDDELDGVFKHAQRRQLGDVAGEVQLHKVPLLHLLGVHQAQHAVCGVV
jgi:hypothetical protein